MDLAVVYTAQPDRNGAAVHYWALAHAGICIPPERAINAGYRT